MNHRTVSNVGVVLAAFGLLVWTLPASASASPLEDPAGATLRQGHETSHDVPEAGEAAEHDEGHEYRNKLLVFLGETWERVDGTDLTERGFTFGLEYTRNLTDKISVGGVFERAGGNIRGTLLLAQVYFNPVGGLTFMTGPGVEFRDGHNSGHEAKHRGEALLVRSAHDIETILANRPTTVFVYRVGVAYEFIIDRWILAPAIDIDFVGRDEALVLGGMIGYEF